MKLTKYTSPHQDNSGENAVTLPSRDLRAKVPIENHLYLPLSHRVLRAGEGKPERIRD